ncbi:MAG TPA: FG-GAP-like repeat-containing protein [Acidobacteriaceae bacterium]|nr:FG-GAP-like repeat-containing protein [Acidobacteriaceae bacterium]
MLAKLPNSSIRTAAVSPRHSIPSCVLVTLGLWIVAGQQAFAGPPQTTTALVLSAAGVQTSSVPSQTVVTLTATVTADGSSVTTGQVSFCNATAPVCTDVNRLGIAQLTAAGTATFAFVPGSGVHSYAAIFGGNTNASASRSPAQTLSVHSAPTGNDPADPPPSEIPSYLKANAATALGTTALTLGASNLSLTPGATYPTGQLPSATVTADFNGDGILDLAITVFDSLGTYVPGSVIILLGKGDGTFTAAPTLVTDALPCCLVTADFNGDGKPDLAFGGTTDGSISIFLGNGDGTFTQGVSISGKFADNLALAVGDFNGDGNEDLIVSETAANSIRVLLGRGDGTFTSVPETPATGDNPNGMAVGDFNHDGHLDIAVSNVFPQPGSDAPSSVTILLGNGDGTFTPAPSIPVGVAPEQILAADFNGDGKLDLAVLNIGTPTTISLLFGNGDGTFDSSTPQIPLPYLSWFTLGDFNGDRKPDIGGFLEVYQPTNVNQNVYALINNGDGAFASITASDSQIPNGGVAGDFNGDGLADLAVTGEYGGLSIYLTTINGLPATTTTLTCNPSTLSVNTESLFSATVFSASGTPTGSILLTDNGAALGQLTLTNGVASYDFTARQSGTRTIVATYVPTGSFAASSASCVLTVSGYSTIAALSVTPTLASQGTPIRLTASVSGGPPGFRGSPVGTITFYNGSTVIDAGAHLLAGTVSFTTTTLPPGIDYLTCTYSGNSTFAPSTCNTVPVTITQTSSVISLTSSLNPAPSLTPITFTAQIAPGSSGTIVFNVNGQDITTTPNAAGTATYTTSSLIPGRYLITASYFATPGTLTAQASLVQAVTLPVVPPDFSLTGTDITVQINHAGTGKLSLVSLGSFAGSVALTCNPPYPPGYTCKLQTSNVSLPRGLSTQVAYTLSPTYSASTHSIAHSTPVALAALLPLSFFGLMGLARKRLATARILLCLVVLSTLATMTTACGPDHFIPITTGTYPITFTGVGTSQNAPTPITHTVTIHATIAP